MYKALLITVNGRVQGVGFRQYALRTAKENDVKGYVKNLPNGEVEIFCQSESENMERFLELIKKGPSFSFISKTKINSAAINENIKYFEIIY